MEPADQRRDDIGTTCQWIYQPWPQWSPPINGGMTLAGGPVERPDDEPQWSPPINGGMTAREKRAC